MDRLPRTARSCARQRRLARWHGQRISGLIAAWAPRTTPFAGGAEPTIRGLRVRIGRFMAIGKASGLRIRRRFAPTSTSCSPLDAGRHGNEVLMGLMGCLQTLPSEVDVDPGGR